MDILRTFARVILLWSLLLRKYVYAAEVDVYVTAESWEDVGSGIPEDPFVDLMYALNLMADPGPASYAFLLIPSETETFQLWEGAEETYNTPFQSLPNEVLEVTISTVYCDDPGQSSVPDWGTNRETRAIIDYRSPQILFTFLTEVRIIIENVVFTSAYLLVDGWTEEWCKHCHWPDALVEDYGDFYTATYHNFGDGSDPIFDSLLNSSNGCGSDRGWNLSVDSKGQDPLLLSFWLFTVDNENASLEITNSKFEDWRFLQTSVIHIYKGQVILTEVDFEFTESSFQSMKFGTLSQTSGIYSVPGIVTANKQDAIGCASGFSGEYAGVPKPCGRFSWTGGSVTHHNYDINPTYSGTDFTSIFQPFLNMAYLEEVFISGITASLNSMITDANADWLFQIRSCSKITVEDWTFDQNWVETGAFAILLHKEDVAVWNDPTALDQVHYRISRWTFTKNKSGLNSRMRGLINIWSPNWVSITLEDISISESASISNSVLLSFQTIDPSTDSDEDILNDVRDVIGWTGIDAYPHQALLDEFEITQPITIDIVRLKIFNNFGGTLLSTTMVPRLQISGSEFIDNSSWTWTDNEWSDEPNDFYDLAAHYIDNGMIVYTRYFQAQNYDGEHLYDDVSWATAILVDGSHQIFISNSTISRNNCSYGDIMFLDNISLDILIDDVDFEENVPGHEESGVLILAPLARDASNMPIIRNSNFIDNKNEQALYAKGCVAIKNVPEYTNGDYTPILTVENCQFIGNIADEHTAIYWIGQSLKVSDTLIKQNSNKTSATIGFQHNSFNTDTATEPVNFTRVTFEENVADATIVASHFVVDIRIWDTFGVATVQIEMDSVTFKNPSCYKCSSVKFQDIWLNSNSIIQNTRFEDMTNWGAVELFIHAGDIEFKSVTFSNIQAEDGVAFVEVGASGDKAEITFTSCNFLDSTGRYGIETSTSHADTKIVSQDWLVQGNDMQFINIEKIRKYTDTGSQILNNRANLYSFNAPFLGLHKQSEAELNGTIVTGNTAKQYAGAINVINKDSILYVNGGQFIRNQAREFDNPSSQTRAGVIMVQDDAKIVVENSLFEENFAYNGSAIMISARKDHRSTIKGSQFVNNQGLGVIRALDSDIHIESCSFERNWSTDRGGNSLSPGVLGLVSDITIITSTFKDQQCSEGCFVNLNQSYLIDQGNTYTNANSHYAGGAIFSNASNLESSGSTFYGNIAQGSADIFLDNQSEMYADNLIFDNSQTTNGDAAWIGLDNSLIQIQNSNFRNFNNTAIIIYLSVDLNVILGCSFSNGGDREFALGGAIGFIGSNALEIVNSTFENLSAAAGGAIHLEGYVWNTATVIIDNVTITGCLSNVGGGIYATVAVLELRNSVFSRNSADYDPSKEHEILSLNYEEARSNHIETIYVGGAVATNGLFADSSITSWKFTENTSTSGGAIFINERMSIISGWTFNQNQVPHTGGALYYRCSECELQIQDCSFSENRADELAGGAIYWENIEPQMTGITYINNQSPQGSDISGDAQRITQVSTRRLKDGEKIKQIKSGQPFDEIFEFEMVDRYGQRVLYDSFTSASITSKEILDGDMFSQAENGYLSFSNFTVTAKPGTNVTIEVFAFGTTSFGEEVDFQTSFLVELQLCDIGEIELDTGACQKCNANGNEYSLEAGKRTCEDCPDEAECFGGFVVYPKEDYWREGWESTQFYECRIKGAWLGGEDTQNFSGEWEVGYSGRLCTVCEVDFVRVGKYQCNKCIENAWINYAIFIIYCIGIIAFSLFLLRSNTETANRQKISNTTVLLRILTNYFQLIVLVQTLRLDWPSFVRSYMDNSSKVGSSTETVFSIDCIISQDNWAPVYSQLIVMSIFPVAIVIICIILWIILKWVMTWMTRSQQMLWIEGTIINLFYLIHPVILKIWLSMFSWVLIEDKKYLDLYMDDECWTGDHEVFALSLALPSLIVWGAGMPLVAFYYISRAHKTDAYATKPIMIKWGFLYLGYHTQKYWWDLIILCRKIAVLIALVWLNLISIEVQALAAIFVLYISLHLQYKNMPYLTDQLNKIEVLSLTCGMITIYLGEYYLTGDIGTETKIILFAIILICTLFFVVNWLIEYVGNVAQEKPFLHRLMLEYQIVDNDIRDFPNSMILIPLSIPKDKPEFVKNLINGDFEYAPQKSSLFISQCMNDRKSVMSELFRDILDDMNKEKEAKKQDDDENISKNRSISFSDETCFTEPAKSLKERTLDKINK